VVTAAHLKVDVVIDGDKVVFVRVLNTTTPLEVNTLAPGQSLQSVNASPQSSRCNDGDDLVLVEHAVWLVLIVKNYRHFEKHNTPMPKQSADRGHTPHLEEVAVDDGHEVVLIVHVVQQRGTTVAGSRSYTTLESLLCSHPVQLCQQQVMPHLKVVVVDDGDEVVLIMHVVQQRGAAAVALVRRRPQRRPQPKRLACPHLPTQRGKGKM
jgi:hypothetical protein